MNRSVKVYPNLGAEEGLAPSDLPPVAAESVRAFTWLFGTGAELLDWSGEAPWPPALGPPPEAPLFEWIRGEAHAWLPDAEAQARLSATGARLRLPSPAVVRSVNDKAFAHRAAVRHGLLPEPIAPLFEVFEPEALEPARLRERVDRLPTWVGRDWVLKPRHGSSGRGRVRRLQDLAGARERLKQRGGAIFEPWLRRVGDLSALLHLGPAGQITWIGTTRQILRGAGVYQGSRGLLTEAGELRAGTPWDETLRQAALALAAEASAAGYFGPMGIDAFVFEGPDGTPLLRPVVEVNARFTMGIVAAGLLLRAREVGLVCGPATWTFSVTGLEEGLKRLRLGERIRLGFEPLPA
mgnify:CR=1 FL=1